MKDESGKTRTKALFISLNSNCKNPNSNCNYCLLYIFTCVCMYGWMDGWMDFGLVHMESQVSSHLGSIRAISSIHIMKVGTYHFTHGSNS